MLADLHIHVKEEDLDESVFQAFFSSSLGSKWFSWNQKPWSERESSFDRMVNTPNIWIGSVSWLKAGLVEDGAKHYVPPTVQQISNLIGEEWPVINDALINSIVSAFDAPNDTGYSLAPVEEVQAFLEEHRGKPVFTISW